MGKEGILNSPIFGDVVDFKVQGQAIRYVVIGESLRVPGCLVLANRTCRGIHCHPSNCKPTGGDRLILARQLRKRYEERFHGRLVQWIPPIRRNSNEI